MLSFVAAFVYMYMGRCQARRAIINNALNNGVAIAKKRQKGEKYARLSLGPIVFTVHVFQSYKGIQYTFCSRGVQINASN